MYLIVSVSVIKGLMFLLYNLSSSSSSIPLPSLYPPPLPLSPPSILLPSLYPPPSILLLSPPPSPLLPLPSSLSPPPSPLLPLPSSPLQRIRATLNQAENKRLLMDYNVAMRSLACPYTITFYGALFREVCMCC